MREEKEEIKSGVSVHYLKNKQFKTNLTAVFLTTPLSRDTITYYSVLTAVLRDGTSKFKSQDEIYKRLEEMYGASLNCGVEKSGDNLVIKFYVECLNDMFIPSKESVEKQALEMLMEIIFSPKIEDDKFDSNYVKMEKENIKKMIEGKIDNKASYAYERCIEEMYKDKPYGIYKYGYIEDLDNINEENLYEVYKKLIDDCKIDFFFSGDIEKEKTRQNLISQNLWEKVKQRNANFVHPEDEVSDDVGNIKKIEDEMDVTQGKLVIGLDVEKNEEKYKYATSVYNAILGGGANSKLFQNVREKASLAYTAASSYLRKKNNIFIRCGIEIKNYQKALDIIKIQLDDMKNGNFNDKDVEDAKELIISSINSIPEEQDGEISYYFAQELSRFSTSLEEYVENIQRIDKKQVIEIANSVKINTIYFLTNNKKGETNEDSKEQ